jgi:hypothetical protein
MSILMDCTHRTRPTMILGAILCLAVCVPMGLVMLRFGFEISSLND